MQLNTSKQARRRLGLLALLNIVTLTSGLGPATTEAGFARDPRPFQLYTQASETKDPDEKIKLLRNALELSPKYFDAWYDLGRAYLDKDAYVEAQQAFEEARKFSPDNEARAWAMAGIGNAACSGGDRFNAVQWLRKAVKVFTGDPSGAPADMRDLLLECDIERSNHPESSDSIYLALAGNTSYQKSFGVDLRRIDLPVNFATDRDEVDSTPDGMRQVEELAKAIAKKGRIDQRYELIGHTDVRGTPEHNMDLSQRRADSVKNYIAQHVPEVADLLCALGKGESEPLHKELPRPDDENDDANAEIHRVNRRVVVEIVDSCN